MDKTRRCFTLLELITVVIIMGILASIAFPVFTKTKEEVLNKEAKANLKLIQAAEKIYKMELGVYCASSDIDTINPSLKLDLTGQNWSYSADTTGTGTATRAGRTWTLYISNPDEPICSPSSNCPP